jgi:hypothetical protein
MTDLWLPDYLRQARTSLRYIDQTGRSRGMFSGALKTAALGGDRLGLTIEFTKHGGKSTTGKSERAILRSSIIARLRGGQNRIYARDLSYRRRGSFPATELLTNNTFVSGTNGYAAGGSAFTISASDRSLRLVRNQSYSSADILVPSSGTTVTINVPYVARVFENAGLGSWTAVGVQAGSTSGGSEYGFTSSAVGGMKALCFVPDTTPTYFGLVDFQTSGMFAGDYYETPYISMARCFQVDNSPNDMLFSTAFDQWTTSSGVTGATITANSTAGPDENVNADSLVENGANSQHYTTQNFTASSSAHDRTAWCMVKASGRNFVTLQMSHATGSVTQYFNVTAGAGAVGSTASTTAGWSNRRAFVRDFGNNWYLCVLIARKTSADASITFNILAASADGTNSYAGSSSTALILSRGGSAASSMPVYPPTNNASAVSSGTAQTGSGIRVKGLPPSTNGLLLVDDQVGIETSRGPELKFVTAPLNSDAAGLGYLQFEPPLRQSPADSAPIMVHEPMGRFAYVGESPGWDNDPGFWSTASCELEEA